MLSQAILGMIRLNGNDTRRINHALKVLGLARCIAGQEGVTGDTITVIELAAVLHDIAIHHCEQTYGSCGGKLQEREGPAIARPILDRCGAEPEVKDRVLFIIAHHHTYGSVDGIDYQILIEADFLVNRDEGDFTQDAFQAVYEKYFKTNTGKELAKVMFGVG